MGGGGSKPAAKSSARGGAPGGRPSGGPSRANNNAVMQATQQMKTTIQNLEKRKTLLENRKRKLNQVALAYKKQGDKKQALLALKRGKILSKHIENVDAQMFNLETQQLNLEGGSTTVQVVEAANAAAQAQRQMMRNGNLNIDTVDNLIEANEDFAAELEGVNDILGQSANEALNDADLERELAMLDADEFEKEAFKNPTKPAVRTANGLPQVPNKDVLDLPTVPANVPVPAKKPIAVGADDDDAELAALEASLL